MAIVAVVVAGVFVGHPAGASGTAGKDKPSGAAVAGSGESTTRHPWPHKTNNTVPARGTSPRSSGISRRTSAAIFRFTARIRFARWTKNPHRPKAHVAIVCDRTDPPPVV